ncbi:MAG TPA: periplasmic heavy metal sensor [bacterium (Candidatus Stahlbacteria)]|nr:periplasmic heavy metal sensor [Candidatus Stahlbacteria bacterium]
MRRKPLILALVLSVAINVAVLATAGYHWRGRRAEEQHHRAGGHSPTSFLHRELALSESQVRQMESLGRPLEQKIDRIKEELREKRAQLVDLLMEPQPNREEINVKVSEIESLQTGIQKLIIDHLLQQKEILTPEQQKKFFSIISERLCPGHQGEGLLPMMEESKGECKHE